MAIFNVKNPYILFIFLLLFSFLFFSIWSARQAATRGSQISDHNYYSKGLKYNNTRVEERAAASRGWQLATKIEERVLSFTLTDSHGEPIQQAAGDLTLFLSEKNRVVHLSLTEQSPGNYKIELPAEITGSVQARIEFEQRDARISRQLLVNL